MSDIIRKKEIIDIIDTLYKGFHFETTTKDVCFSIETKKGRFGYFGTSDETKNYFIVRYNQFKNLIDIIKEIDYKVFEIIKDFLNHLNGLLMSRIVSVDDKYVKDKYIFTIKDYYDFNPIRIEKDFPSINKNFQGKIITKDIIESLRVYRNRFEILDWTNVHRVEKFETLKPGKVL